MAQRTKQRVSAGAAAVLGLGFAGIAFATPAQAEISADLTYNCTTPFFDDQVDLGEWTVAMTVDPSSLPAGVRTTTNFTAEVTPSETANDLLRDLKNAETVEGSANATYTLAGEPDTASLTFPSTAVPAKGTPLVVTATGTGPVSIEEDSTLVAGDFQTTLEINGDPNDNVTVNCELEGSGDVGEITVEPGETTPPTTDPTETEAPIEVDDWFDEPSQLPVAADRSSFSVEGTASRAGTLVVQLLDSNRELLTSYEESVAEGAFSGDFDFVDGTNYVRLVSQDCVDVNGDTEEVVGSGCNVEYIADWASTSDGDDDDNGSGSPETPGVVQTDALQRVQPGDSTNGAALALGGVLLAGAAAGSVVVLRRRAAAQH